MTALPIAFQSDPGRYNFEGSAQLLNAYAEKRGADAKAPLSVLPADGIVDLGTAESPGPCRGLIYLEDLDAAYAVHPSNVYKITHAAGVFTATRIGNIPGNDTVQLSRNQNAAPQIVVRSDAGVQIIQSDAVAFIADEDLPDDAVTADFVGGYHAYGFEDRTFYLSGLNSAGEVDGADFATFEQKAGKLIRIVEHSGNLYGLCSRWSEVWRNTGNADFPFEPIATLSRGIKSADGVTICDNALFAVTDDGLICRLDNTNWQRVSTHHVERLIQADAAAEDIFGFSWTRDGHAFANFTGSTWTRCYDAATGVWHSRESYGYDRWRARHSIRAWGKTIVGDRFGGKLGYLARDTFTEYGEPMVWGVDSPTLHVFPNGGICDALHLDIATGYGLLSGQGSNPQVMLQVSTDGGNTFGQYRELELGVTGRYATRVTARRLGRFGPKGMVFRLRISDPVVRALIGAAVDVRPLRK